MTLARKQQSDAGMHTAGMWCEWITRSVRKIRSSGRVTYIDSYGIANDSVLIGGPLMPANYIERFDYAPVFVI